MENFKIIRDLGVTFLKKLDLSNANREKENKELIKTIDDGLSVIHKVVKEMPKPEKIEQIDLKPLVESEKSEGKSTRESIKLVEKELIAIKSTIKDTSKDIVEASKLTSKAIANIKIDNPIIKQEKPDKIDFNGILSPIKTILTSIKTVFENKGTKKEPIYVISVDELGNINEGGGETRSYGGFSRDIMGLNNIEGKAINPSTEEKQDALITAIENIEIPPAPGVATEAKQDTQIVNQETLISLVETLQELNARLQVIAGMANAGQPALRTIPIASVSTAVTGTLTSVGTLTNFGTGYPAKEMSDDINNYTAIAANINNISIT